MNDVHDGLPLATISLTDYWFEEISREEGLQRLERRHLDPNLKAEIAKEIPERSLHYFSVGGGWFREFVNFDENVVHPLLLVPLNQRESNLYDMATLQYVPDVSTAKCPKRLNRVDLVEVEVRNDILVLEKEPVQKLKFVIGPTDLKLIVSFLQLKGHPCCTRCCRACEWVHSRFDPLHRFDQYCCLGGCPVG